MPSAVLIGASFLGMVRTGGWAKKDIFACAPWQLLKRVSHTTFAVRTIDFSSVPFAHFWFLTVSNNFAFSLYPHDPSLSSVVTASTLEK